MALVRPAAPARPTKPRGSVPDDGAKRGMAFENRSDRDAQGVPMTDPAASGAGIPGL